MQCDFQDAEGCRVLDDAVWGERCNCGVVRSTGTDCDLGYAIDRVGQARWGLGSEAFVDVVVAVENQVGVGGIELIPQRLGHAARPAAGAE